MKNKKQIIILISIIIILIIGFLILYSLMNKNKQDEIVKKLDTKVTSTITLDINPSIKIELNKNKLVVKVVSLNIDAENVIDNNYSGKKLEETINEIIGSLVNKGYTKEKLFILIGTSGEIKEDEVKKIIDNRLTTQNIDYDVIIPKINESSKELAKKYNITESKAAYIEEIAKENSNIKIEDLKDMNIKEIVDTLEKESKIKNENNIKENITKKQQNKNTTNKSSSTSKASGSIDKCNYVNIALTNEEAGKKIASLMGASVGTGKYCDKLPPESVMVLTNDNVCAYKVSFAYRTKSCVYYVDVESGNIIGQPSCTSKLVDEGEAQCIIMDSMGITAREQFYAKNNRDNGSEWVYDVEDVYGIPDELGKIYVYEYHVSKSTGQITSKVAIKELQ